MVSFSTESKKNALFFKKICDLIEIKTSKCLFSKGCWNVFITGHENFEKLIKLRCVTHKTRQKNLNKIVLNSTRSRYIDYLNTVHQGHNTTIEAAKHMGLSDITTRFYFAKLTRNGFLTRRIGPSRSYGYLYRISEKGKQKLEFYQKIKDEIF